RPQHVQGEQAYPTRGVDRILVRMIAGFRNKIRNVMDRDDSVEERDDYENQQAKREVVKERIANHFISAPILRERRQALLQSYGQASEADGCLEAHLFSLQFQNDAVRIP